MEAVIYAELLPGFMVEGNVISYTHQTCTFFRYNSVNCISIIFSTYGFM